MPRPTKAFKRQKLSAAAAWKRGERKEAYELWEKAAKSLQEHRAKKRNKAGTSSEGTPSTAAPA